MMAFSSCWNLAILVFFEERNSWLSTKESIASAMHIIVWFSRQLSGDGSLLFLFCMAWARSQILTPLICMGCSFESSWDSRSTFSSWSTALSTSIEASTASTKAMGLSSSVCLASGSCSVASSVWAGGATAASVFGEFMPLWWLFAESGSPFWPPLVTLSLQSHCFLAEKMTKGH